MITTSLSCPKNVFLLSRISLCKFQLLYAASQISPLWNWRVSRCFLSLGPACFLLVSRSALWSTRRAGRAVFQHPFCPCAWAGKSYRLSRMLNGLYRHKTQKCSSECAVWGVFWTPGLTTSCNVCVNWGKGLIWSRSVRSQCKMVAGNSSLESAVTFTAYQIYNRVKYLVTLGINACISLYLRCSLFNRMNYMSM